MFRRFFLCGAVTWTGFSTGCGEQAQAPSNPVTQSKASQDAPASDRVAGVSNSPSKDGASPTIKPDDLMELNWNELQSLIAEQKGKIVVVDVWSTACEPCMKEFPHLITLQKRYPEDVVAISFDIDYAGIKNKPVSYYRERVLKFLGSQTESKILHRMCNTSADELFTAINLDSIPAIYVYGRDGTLAKRFDGSNSQSEGVSYEKQVIPFVADLMK